jgi:hypothetical protein
MNKFKITYSCDGENDSTIVVYASSEDEAIDLLHPEVDIIEVKRL